MSKLMTIKEAIELIKDGDTVAASGFAGAGTPEDLFAGVEESFVEKGTPRDLTIVYAAGLGEWKKGRGLDRFAHEGLLKRAIGGHFGIGPTLSVMAGENKFEAYNFPQGVIDDLFHEALKGMPFHLTKLGLKTFVDPRIEGGRCNEITKEDLVKVVEIEGEEYLSYQVPKIDIALIRGTSADQYGNISFEEEALPVDMRLIAMAVHSQGGKVIAQVKYTCDRLMTDQVRIPGIFVDAVVVSENPLTNHRQTGEFIYRPELSGHVFVPQKAADRIPLDVKKLMGRRAAMEITPNSIINLGVGAPEFVGTVAGEEGCSELMTMTSESGAIAGVPLGGLSFGSVTNAYAVLEELQQFDFYDGGGLDVTYLGLAEIDKAGNVNVSHFGTAVTGCGGFINISQTTKDVVFVGTFTAGGLKEEVKDGKLTIIQEGKKKKFIDKVQQITFSAEFANETNQNVLIVTERAVFKIVKEGLKLIELAPGVDLQKDILDQMDFAPIVEDYTLMNEDLFREPNFGLKDIIMAKSK